MNTMSHTQPQSSTFLQDLPTSIPRYTYNGRDQFDTLINLERKRLESSFQVQTGPKVQNDHTQNLHTMHLRSTNKGSSEYILFIISPHNLRKDFLNKDRATGLSLRLSYNLRTNLLLVKLIHGVYFETLCRFHQMIFLSLNTMNLGYEFMNYPGINITGNGTGKEADWAWGPAVTSPEYTGRPTVVLEVSSDMQMLERDVCWWLSEDGGRAKMAVTVLVDSDRIILDVWGVGLRRERMQHVCIEKGRRRKVLVMGGPLVIPFESLFLRRARGGLEGDVVLSKEDLESFAGCVWRVQSAFSRMR